MAHNVDEANPHMHDYEAHVRAVEEDLEYYRTKRFEPRVYYFSRRGTITLYDILKAKSAMESQAKFTKGGKEGVIVAVRGVINNPFDHRGLYPPLYSVMFDIKEVFGKSSGDKLWVDVHEEWLEGA